MIDLKLGDCLELMKEIPDKSIDMVCCDLPYGQTKNKWDIIIPFDELWEGYSRIIKDNGAIVLFGQGMFTAKLMLSNTKMWRYNLIWDKVLCSGPLNANRMPMRSHEDICIFYKKLCTYNPQKVIGNKNHSKGTMKKNVNNNYGKFKAVDNSDRLGNLKHPKSIVTFSKIHPSVTLHPTQKPVELIEWLIKTYTNEGEMVLDNCMGSGTTPEACFNTSRSCIGIEKDVDIFEVALNRVEEKVNEIS